MRCVFLMSFVVRLQRSQPVLLHASSATIPMRFAYDLDAAVILIHSLRHLSLSQNPLMKPSGA